MSTQLTYAQISKSLLPGRYFDGGTGLHLLVTKAVHRRYWVFRYKYNGRRRDMSLGVFPRVSLAEARRKTLEARVLLDAGISPLDLRTPVVDTVTTEPPPQTNFKDFSLAYVEARRPEWRNKKHAEQWLYTLKEYAYPIIGHLSLDQIDTDDILRTLEPIWHTKTETASRLRGWIERILSAATARKLRVGPNPAGWRGHLDTLLAQPKKVARVKHHEALPFVALPDFVHRLQGREAMAALALEFAILTASRTGEVIGATRAEVVGDVWTIPAERMKAGRMHRVPLVPRAVAILDAAIRQDPHSEFLFSRRGRPLSNIAMLKVLERMHCKVTVHGFRSTFRDWASEVTTHSPELAEMALAHTIGNKVEAAYRRGDLFNARKQLMHDWSAYCLSTA